MPVPNVGEGRRAFGFEQIADCGSMRVVGLRLEPGQAVPEHRNAIPVAVIVTGGRLHFDDGVQSGEVGTGEMLLINPGERPPYRVDVPRPGKGKPPPVTITATGIALRCS